MYKSADCPENCPHEKEIDQLYKSVIVGNGEGPIKGRVKALEAEMATILPTLEALKSASERQEGRDLERIDAEKRRDKSQETFRRNLTIVVIVASLLLAGATFYKQFRAAVTTFPQMFAPDHRSEIYTANKSNQPIDAGLPEAYMSK